MRDVKRLVDGMSPSSTITGGRINNNDDIHPIYPVDNFTINRPSTAQNMCNLPNQGKGLDARDFKAARIMNQSNRRKIQPKPVEEIFLDQSEKEDEEPQLDENKLKIIMDIMSELMDIKQRVEDERKLFKIDMQSPVI